MRKLIVFNQVSLDGYYVDSAGDMSWAHKHDAEWREFSASNAQSDGTLVFGRVTYEMMASYWPSAMAKKNDPEVAEGMNRLAKVVFSRTLDRATWKNTRLLKGDLASEVQKLKREPGGDLVILGSGMLVAQLAQQDVIDAYQIVINPIVLGSGKSMFAGAKRSLALTDTRVFKNGNVVLSYARA